jgi:hypothetical protein
LVAKYQRNQYTFLEKSGFPILIALKNQPEKGSHLFLYLLGTQKYPEMFLMPFFAAGPFKPKKLKFTKDKME